MDLSLREIGSGLRDRRFTAAQLAQEARENLDATEAALGAYKLRTPDLAREGAARADAALRAGNDAGVLQGIPVSVKDIYGIPGLPIFAGSSHELPAHWQAAGPVARTVLDALAVIMGKTHTVEFAFGALGMNANWPTPRNPWSREAHRAPGGSSSGAGVALCQGSAVIALGTDTAGSVRVPASATGNVGYKPTIGRWSTAGIVPLSPYLDTPGLLARTVDDALLAADLVDRHIGPAASRMVASPPTRLRIGVPEQLFWDDCDAGIAEGVRTALSELERAGHRLVPLRFPEAGAAFDFFKAGGTAGAELLAFLRHELPDWIERLDPNVGIRMRVASELPAAEFLVRKMQADAMARSAQARFAELDVVATPTIPQTPPDILAIRDWEQYRPLNLRNVRNTCVANILQLCSLTLPVALDAQRMPVGLQLMAAGGRDDLLFAAGIAFEKVLGTARARIGTPPPTRRTSIAAAVEESAAK